MFILDVGKVKYNKKFYKAIIYTTMIMDIISFGGFPRSQSKYKDDNISKYSYSANLYAEKVITNIEHDVDIRIPESNIELLENSSEYISDKENAFFTYQLVGTDIEGVTHPLNFTNINKNIEFNYTTTDKNISGSCDIVEEQTSINNKGIIWCSYEGSNTYNNDYFTHTGITVSVNANDTYSTLSETEKNTYNLTITGNREFDGLEYKKHLDEEKNPLKLTISDINDCTSFNQWLIAYNDYYMTNAQTSYKNDTGSEISKYSFNGYDAIKNYVKDYASDTTCNLSTINLKGLDTEVITSPSGKKQYTFTIKDNFIGYAKTYTLNNGNMYFTTSDGREFNSEVDTTKWNKIFEEYIEFLYPNRNMTNEIKNYLISKLGKYDILEILQKTTAYKEVVGLNYSYNNDKIISIKESLFDNAYNLEHRSSGKVRITEDSNVYTMMDSFVNGVSIVYNGILSDNAIKSLYNTEWSTTGAKATEIWNYISNPRTISNGDVYVKDMQYYGLSSVYTIDVHITNDGTYTWLEVLPLAQHYSDNKTILHRFDKYPLYNEDNMLDEYLNRIKQLSKRYGVEVPSSIIDTGETDSVIDISYIRDGSGTPIGYVKILWRNVADTNIRTIYYYAYYADAGETLIGEYHRDNTSISNELNTDENLLSDNKLLLENNNLLNQENIVKKDDNSLLTSDKELYPILDTTSTDKEIDKTSKEETEVTKDDTIIDIDETITDEDSTTENEESEDKKQVVDDENKQTESEEVVDIDTKVTEDETDDKKQIEDKDDSTLNDLDSDKDTKKDITTHDDSDDSDVDTTNDAPNVSTPDDTDTGSLDLTESVDTGETDTSVTPLSLE